MNDNGVEITFDGPNDASMFFGRVDANGNERNSGVKKRTLEAAAITTDNLPPLVIVQPGASANKQINDNIWPHSVAMIEIIHK